MPNEARVKAGVGVHSRCPDREFVAQRSSLSSSYTERSDATTPRRPWGLQRCCRLRTVEETLCSKGNPHSFSRAILVL